MTLQAISKGFLFYKNVGLKFSLYIFPVIILFGFIASLGSSNSLADGISNLDIIFLLFNNFLISPLVTIIAILLANDLIDQKNRDVLVYYALSWQYILKVLVLSLISTIAIGLGLILFVVPGLIMAGLFLFINYFAVLENKSILESITLSWEKARSNLLQSILMASFFWMLTIFSLALLSTLVSNYENLDEIPQIVTIVSSSLAIYIQVCLVCFPILIFFRNLTESNPK